MLMAHCKSIGVDKVVQDSCQLRSVPQLLREVRRNEGLPYHDVRSGPEVRSLGKLELNSVKSLCLVSESSKL